MTALQFRANLRPRRPALWALAALACSAASAVAQIATDGSLGGRQSFAGSNVVIGAGAGTTRGGNVFHSFSDFNVRRGQSVTFTGPSSTKNVLARVTGTNSTLINGPLLNRAGRSRLYVINPLGITVGEGARLDSPGGLVLTTAADVRFADGSLFNAAPGAGGEVLTSADPRSFGFLGGPVDFDNVDLRLPADSSLAVVASGISMSDSVVRVRRGSVSLTAVGDASRFAITPQGSVRSTVNFRDIAGQDASPTGRLAVSDSTFDLSGDPGGVAYFTAGAMLGLTDSQITSQITGTRSGGAIEFITPGTLDLSNTTVTASTTGRARSGGILVRGGSTLLSSGSKFVAQSGIEGVPPNPTSPAGPAGDLDFEGDVLRMTGGSTLTASSYGGGPVGQIRVRMAESISLDGTQERPTGVYAINAAGGGDGRERGLVRLSSPSVTLGDAAQISTAARTDGGSAAIEILGNALTLGGPRTYVASDNFGNGAGGPINVAVGTLAMRDRALISSRAQAGGPAGRITINAKSALTLSDGAQILADTAGAGDGGRIVATAADVTLSDRARISAVTTGAGEGGTIELTSTAGPLAITRSLVSTDTAGTGKGGEILLRAPQINLTGNGVSAATGLAGVYSRSLEGRGDSGVGGAIEVRTGFLRLIDGAVINASTSSNSPGGTISLQVAEKVLVDGGPGRSGGIFADTRGPARGAKGGDIVSKRNVRPDLVLRNGGRITVSSSGGGDAGNINLRLRSFGVEDASIASRAGADGGAGRITVNAARSITMTGSAQVTASSNTGPGGDVELNARTFDATASAVDVGTRGPRPGSIEIHTTESLRLTDSTVRADGVRAVGRLELDEARVILDNSRLITNTGESAPAAVGNGDIDVTGSLVLSSSDTVVQSVGTITVTGLPDTDIAASLIVYAPTLSDAARLVEAKCANRPGTDVSSFIFEPRGGLRGRE